MPELSALLIMSMREHHVKLSYSVAIGNCVSCVHAIDYGITHTIVIKVRGAGAVTNAWACATCNCEVFVVHQCEV